jgi:hypothetical protein
VDPASSQPWGPQQCLVSTGTLHLCSFCWTPESQEWGALPQNQLHRGPVLTWKVNGETLSATPGCLLKSPSCDCLSSSLSIILLSSLSNTLPPRSLLPEKQTPRPRHQQGPTRSLSEKVKAMRIERWIAKEIVYGE